MNHYALLKNRSARKRHVSWEEADTKSNGQHGRNLVEIALLFNNLTLMELKTCALIRSLKGSWEISEILGISEHTVENHRVNIRKKIGLPKGSSLSAKLLCM